MVQNPEDAKIEKKRIQDLTITEKARIVDAFSEMFKL